MDKNTMSFLIEVNKVHNIYTKSMSCAYIELTFVKIFEYELTLLDESVDTDFIYDDTFTRVPFTNEQNYEDLSVEGLELLHELDKPTHFTVQDSLDYGALVTSHDISTCMLDASDY